MPDDPPAAPPSPNLLGVDVGFSKTGKSTGMAWRVGGVIGTHPLVRFATEPAQMAHAKALDDLVFWGALSMLEAAEDVEIRAYAGALRGRRLFRCIDVRERLDEALSAQAHERRDGRRARVALACTRAERLLRLAPNRILTDRYSRAPYKRVQDSQSPLNRILIRTGDGPPRDMADLSPMIAAAEPFDILRAYVRRDDDKAGQTVENVIGTCARETQHDEP